MAGSSLVIGAESIHASGSGIGRVARLMARALSRARAPLVAVALQPGGMPDVSGLEVRSARGSRARFVLEVHRAALHAHSFFYDFAGMARAHCRLPMLRRPYAVWGHGIEIWEDARADRLAAIGRAQLLFINTEYSRARAARSHPGFERARVCWLGTETDHAPARVGPSEAQPTVTILSRLDADGGYKGHRELIDAWPSVLRAVPDAHLCIVGDGPGRRLVEGWVASSTARAQITLTGFIPESGIDAVWARTTVFAMPSRGEGFGLAYIEAMRHGVPVIGSMHDAASEINVDGVTGYNVDLDRGTELAERIVDLLTRPERAHAMGLEGHARWREHFTYSAFERRFLPMAAPLLP